MGNRHIIAAVSELFPATQQRVEPRAVGSRTHDTHSGPSWRRATTIARNMSCSDIVGVPCQRSTRIVYSKVVQDESSIVTSFTMTPRTCRLVTRLMSGRDGGKRPPPTDVMRNQSFSSCYGLALGCCQQPTSIVGMLNFLAKKLNMLIAPG